MEVLIESENSFSEWHYYFESSYKSWDSHLCPARENLVLLHMFYGKLSRIRTETEKQVEVQSRACGFCSHGNNALLPYLMYQGTRHKHPMNRHSDALYEKADYWILFLFLKCDEGHQ